MSGEHLLIIARAASKRLDEANAALHDAEVEHRIAWANYDAVVSPAVRCKNMAHKRYNMTDCSECDREGKS